MLGLNQQKHIIDPESMPRIQRPQLKLETVAGYDPALCKTCQKLGSESPKPARALYSDCEEHFHRRVERLANSGVTILHRGQKFEFPSPR